MVFRQKPGLRIVGDDHAKRARSGKVDTGFAKPIVLKLKYVQQQSGRWAGQGARDCREDGRHPKDEDHGRIAGR
jgi:hypothetical protein